MPRLSSFFGPRVRCDQCLKTFRPKLEDDALPDGGVLRRFACPRCGQQTLVARISARGLALQAELQNTPVNDQRRIAELRKQLKVEVTRG